MRLFTRVPILVLALIAVGCGGGSGGSGEAQGAGRVTMLIGDAPIDDLTKVWITVSEVELNMTGGKKDVVLNPPQRIELLSLQNLTEVLLSEEIVSGRINKVRLLLDNLEILRASSTSPDDLEVLDVPAGGWIELNPQGGIEVRAGETITIFIDVDLERSLHVVQGGNGSYEFRPQVFTEIYSEGDPSRIVRLKGTARGVNPTTDGWDLCDLRRESGDSSNANLMDCVHIVDTDASAYENPSALAENSTVTAFGYMDFGAAEDTMHAKVLVIGEEKPIVTEIGRVDALPDVDTITIDIDPAVTEIRASANLLPGAVTVERHGDTTETLEVEDDVEAVGFRAADQSLDTFLVIHEDAAPAM
jgi:Domain of unknown function (DUF4382)